MSARPEEDAPDRRGLRRGVYILPNLITTTSLFFGFSSVIATVRGEFESAAWFILASAVADAFDGAVARATRTQSMFGQEFDSLSDAIAFGLAPGLLMFLWALEPFGKWGFGAGFLYVACAVLRLARFNVQAATVEKRRFQGLPSPGAAGMIAVTILLYYDIGGEGSPSRHLILLLEAYAVALLMVSNIGYPSSKSLHLESVKSFRTLFFVILALTVLIAAPERALFAASLLYVFSGPLHELRRLGRLRAPRTT